MNKRWKKPILHDHQHEDHQHRATWLELFFDLVFVVTIAELTHRLSVDISLLGVGKFLFLFLPIWWTWIGITFYNNRFQTNDLSERFSTFLVMLGIASLAYHIHAGLSTTSTGFALSYLFVRVIHFLLWYRAGWHNPQMKSIIHRYLFGIGATIVLWSCSLFFDTPIRFLLWGAGLLIEIIMPLTTLKLQKRHGSMEVSDYLPERFGLFMIIVLGESIIAVVRGISNTHHLTSNSLFTACLGAVFAFMIWWLYFDYINPRRIKDHPYFLATWAYVHFPLVTGIAALGAGILNLIELNGYLLPINVVWLVCGSMALSLGSIGILEYTLKPERGRGMTPCKTSSGKSIRFGGMALCLILPFFTSLHLAWILLSILILITSLQILHSEISDCHRHEENVLNEINA